MGILNFVINLIPDNIWFAIPVMDTNNFSSFLLPIILLLGLTSTIMLLTRSWRLMMVVLAFQYLGVFILVLLVWPINLSLVKMVSGLMACLILATSLSNSSATFQEDRFAPSGSLFRLLASGLVFLMMFSAASGLQTWLTGVNTANIWAGSILMGMGLFHLSLTANPTRSIVGVLTVYSGFEVIYSALENSALVAALLAIFTVGLALVGAYLQAAPDLEEEN